MAQPETINFEFFANETPRKPADVSEDNFRYANMSAEWRDELLDPAGWDNVLETFAVTMKLAAALTDLDGRMVGRCHNPQSIWLLARAAKSPADGDCPFCLAPAGFCSAVKAALSSGSAVTVEDPAGLALAVPLFLDGQQLGSLIAGQVFVRSPEAMPLQRTARDWGIGQQRLFQAAIAQVLVSPATLRMYGSLLMSLGQACVGERHAVILHKKLIQTSRPYRLFLDGVNDYAFYTVDAAGRVTGWNKGAERLFGYTETEMLGRDSSCLLVAESTAALEHRMVEAERLGSAKFESWRIRKDGARFFGAGILVSMGSGNNREYGRLVRDVTEARRLEHDLLQAQKLESIEGLARGIAHDFSALLTGITGSLSFVKASLPVDSPPCQTIEIAERSSAEAAELVEQLSVFADKDKCVLAQLDFSMLIRDMAPLLAASIPKTVELDLALTPGLPCLEGDFTQIRQLVMNLIINGAGAIGPEGGTVRVSTGLSDSGNEIFIQVKDPGPSMSETTQVKLFNPVPGIVRSHNGRMTVNSTPEKGTTVTVTFPGVPAGVVKPAEPFTPRIPDNTGTILIADDEDSLRNLARAILENSGYSVLLAKNGREAVEMFRQASANIATVVLDITMPIMGGQEASGLIREIRPEVPIIMSSGYGEVAEESGGDGAPGLFIQKPYSATKLIASIRYALRQS